MEMHDASGNTRFMEEIGGEDDEQEGEDDEIESGVWSLGGRRHSVVGAVQCRGGLERAADMNVNTHLAAAFRREPGTCIANMCRVAIDAAVAAGKVDDSPYTREDLNEACGWAAPAAQDCTVQGCAEGGFAQGHRALANARESRA